MSNPISPEIKIGTIGELLVQTRLLQYDVQAAPPLKDSGNDFIALKGDSIKTIQVKTRTTGEFNTSGLEKKKYHLLALVYLAGEDKNIFLDDSVVFILTKDEVTKSSFKFSELKDKKLTAERVNELFS